MRTKTMLIQGLAVFIGLPLLAFLLESADLVSYGVGGGLFALGFLVGGAMVSTALVLMVRRSVVNAPPD